MRYSRYISIILIILIFGAVPLSTAVKEDLFTFKGKVLDYESQQPINNATVTVWENQITVTRGYTDALGFFTVQVPKGHNYIIYIYADSLSSLGWDYFPALREAISPTSDMDFTVELRPGASIKIDNDIDFVDSTTAATTYTYEVKYPESGEILEIEGYKPIYGTPGKGQNNFLNLNSSQLIVPANIAFSIKVNASEVVAGKVVDRIFSIDEPEHIKLPKGDLMHLDIRKYSFQCNLGLVEEKMNEVKAKLDAMDKQDFYLSLEKHRLVAVSGMVDTAKFNLLSGDYVNSFKELRTAYIEFTDLYSSLVGMYASAEMSVYVLIFFLAFTAASICFLLFEKSLQKVIGSGILTALVLIVLREIYPGAAYVPITTFLEISIIAWCTTLLTIVIFPHFLKGASVDGKTPTWNVVVPIFSIAKRSLTRRKIRFILVLSSVTILVMSFVVLTSFSKGYGLIMYRVSNQQIPLNGDMIRFPADELSANSFTPLDAAAIKWVQDQSEVKLMVPKAESQPLPEPFLMLGGKSLYGVVGILPSAEAQILKLDQLIVEGRYLKDGEEKSILISDDLKKELRAEVNSTFLLSGMNVTIVGILKGEELGLLKDLDGNLLIPNKLVNLSPPGTSPQFQAVPVKTDELVICSLDTSLQIPGVFLSLIDAILREGKSANDFAERAALERNYDVWASSNEGLYLARLGTYFQGEGVSLAVPWAIVVLNVIITMLNALHERRKEVSILSAIGLNPSHITGIFVAEALAIGLIGGGLGYLSGLGMYKMMSLLNITLEVRQKVSATWCLGALAIAMAAVIVGTISAIKRSVVITPSLMRRWEDKGSEDLILPIRVPQNEIYNFIKYVLGILMENENDPIARTERIKILKEDTAEINTKGIRFIYRTMEVATKSYSTNRLIAEKRKGEEAYTVRMLSEGDWDWVNHTRRFVRMIIMRWSLTKK
jgi:ABC-type lipoprotein release transport system permease subunit